MVDGSPPPYRSGMATSLGVVLVTALGFAIGDVVHAGGGLAPAPALLGLWAVLALPIAIGTGFVLGAGNATWGPGWVRGLFRKLHDEPDLDRAVAAIMLAAAVVGGVLALGVAKLSIVLVGEVQRKAVGGLLLGFVVVGAVPVLALGALPLYRVMRHVAGIIPALGPVSRVVLIAIAAVVAATVAGLRVVLHGLDTPAEKLATMIVPAAMPVGAIAVAIIAFGPAARLRERIPARGALTAAGAVIALILPWLALRGTPTDAVKDAVMDRSYVGGRVVTALRKFVDRDHDGFSPLFGGPDCNDHDPNINPKAHDIPDNGIDENCDGFDAHAVATPTPHDGGTPEPVAIRGGQNVVMIFIDTLRFDHVGLAGYQRDGKSLTPRLDAFAKQGVVFRHAYAQAPNTPRSVPSFLTSRYPSQLKVDKVFKDYATLDDDNDTLFEALHPAGFMTIGESSHFYFCDHDKYPDTCGDVINVDGKPMHANVIQGADLWDNAGALSIPGSNHDSAGPRIVDKTVKKLDELAASKQKFAMIVHLFEPHSTYMEHPGYPITEHGTAALIQKYDYEIAFEDVQLGRLFDAIDKDGLAANTTVIVMSDHGEAFGVHPGEAGFFHGMSLYQELLHVPVIFRVPGGTPCVADDVVQLVDLAPTIAALFGVTPPSTWVGRSLVPALACKPLPPAPAYAEMLPAPEWNHEAKSMITANAKHHVFYRISDARWEIYDLGSDADERTNVVDTEPDARSLEQELSQWSAAPPAGGAKP